MSQNFSNGIPSPPQRYVCECYKKLQDYGVPLLIAEEDDLCAENAFVAPYEGAFKLPDILKINEDVVEYPMVDENDLFFVFEQMAQVLPGLSDFEQNVVSFWVLDIFIEGLWTAQNAKMSHSHQKATLLWIAYFFNYIQNHNPTRTELFLQLKMVLFPQEYPGEVLSEEEKSQSVSNSGEDEPPKIKRIWKLPLPPEFPEEDNSSLCESDPGHATKSTSYYLKVTVPADEQTKSGNNTVDTEKSALASLEDSKNGETDIEVNLKHMNIILEILYRIFARLWVFREIQTVFHAMPSVEQVDLPFTLKIPKPLLKPEPPSQTKVEKGSKRPSFSEKSVEEGETERQLHKHDYILPLQAAEESKLYLKQLFGQSTSDRSVLRNREERTKK